MNTLVQVFARAPVLGEVKSRLTAGVGAERALDVYRQLLRFTLLQVASSGFDLEVWMQGADGEAMSDLLTGSDMNVAVHTQAGGDLGQRMHHALVHGQKRYPRVLLVGSDCIDLSPGRLRLASDALERGADVVLGPSADGGYYLVAPAQSHSILFRDVQWGSSKVWGQSLERITRLGWTLTELPLGHDLDDVDDLKTALKWGVVQ
ncbi:MAG: TIGR04282 family arsenosugar biosynthesis glycosyltransferase [Lysobacterales bacterium]